MSIEKKRVMEKTTQQLVNLSFDLLIALHNSKDYFKDKTNEEVAAWARANYRSCGVDLVPVGSSHGTIVNGDESSLFYILLITGSDSNADAIAGYVEDGHFVCTHGSWEAKITFNKDEKNGHLTFHGDDTSTLDFITCVRATNIEDLKEEVVERGYPRYLHYLRSLEE